MPGLTEPLTGLPPALVCLVAGLVVVAEPALLLGVWLPSVGSMVLLGALARAGGLPLPVALGTAVTAAILGDSLGFLAGRRWSGRRDALARRIGPARWSRAERMFDRVGRPALFASRWVTGARTVLPRLAGLTGLPYRGFLIRNAPSGLLWGVTMVGAGWLAGPAYRALAGPLGLAGLGLLAAVALSVPVALLVARLRRSHRAAGAVAGD